ncbi:unnamed protein product [Didymodactylos carnosus]|uniref:PX domain-containing protein n=1 Tax=Didymodactylos carnosus TaxID=1234261 RepID=A0A815FX30_9BILA|nr:unnamed protein product [Didymodactylos carnosus]CAF4184542.1 unnamed protein product [Didymodactylos carnosus]
MLQFSVEIPTTKTVEEDDEKFTVYVIKIRGLTKTIYAERRFREFEDLHKLIPVNTIFPKKVLQNRNPRVIEHRRLMLENFLKDLLSQHPISDELFDFLNLEQLQTDTITDVGDVKLEHAPVISIKDYVFNRSSNKKDYLPDSILDVFKNEIIVMIKCSLLIELGNGKRVS